MARQEITIGGETFESDVEMIPLLNELNNVGLRTTQHCIGHENEGDGLAYLSIAIEPDMDIGIRYDMRPRLIIRWNRFASHNTGSPKSAPEIVEGGSPCPYCKHHDKESTQEPCNSCMEFDEFVGRRLRAGA